MEKTLTIKSTRALKSQITQLMNCAPLNIGVHLYLWNINHKLPGLWAGPLLGSLGLFWACMGLVKAQALGL